MSAVLFVLFGFVVGGVTTIWLLSRSVETDESRRQFARAQAEQRIRDVQTTALHAMADAAENAVRHTTDAALDRSVPRRWPSERSGHVETSAIEGTAVDVSDREG